MTHFFQYLFIAECLGNKIYHLQVRNRSLELIKLNQAFSENKFTNITHVILGLLYHKLTFRKKAVSKYVNILHLDLRV